MPIEIPSEYGYVIAAIGACFVPLSYGAYRVVAARKTFGVKYPDLVRRRWRRAPSSRARARARGRRRARIGRDVARRARSRTARERNETDVARHGGRRRAQYAPHGHEKKKEFDCVQRGHQNTLEQFPTVATTAMCAGLAFPRAAATCLGFWIVGRVLFIRGYATGVPGKRQFGGIVSHLGDIPLVIMCFVAGKRFIDA